MTAHLAAGGRSRVSPFYALLPAAILLAPVLAFLAGSSYALAAPEALFFAGGALLAGAAVGGLVVRATPVPRALLLAACLTLFVDVQLAPARAWQLAAAAAGLALVLLLLRENALPILSAGFGAFLAATLLVPPKAPLQSASGADVGAREVREDLPPILVLVLDEHTGIEGLPLEVEGGAEARSAVRDLYARFGFRLYTRAYSQYAHTLDSLPNLFNFTAQATRRPFVEPVGRNYALRRNLFLARAAKSGYAIRLYEPDYLDYSGADGVRPEFRLQFKTASIGSVQGQKLTWREKAAVIGNSLFARSLLREGAERLLERLARAGLPVPRAEAETGMLVGPYESMAVLDRLQRDVLAGSRGRLFFAHLMIPHFPYTYDAGCEVQTRTPPWARSGAAQPSAREPAPGRETRRRERYRRYFQQVRCLARRLGSFFEALDGAGALEGAVVVVLGDHGSRANEPAPGPADLGKAPARDFVDAFSALFAVRGPGITPGLVETPRPLVQAFAEAVNPGGERPTTESLFLFGEDDGVGTAAPMPPF